MTLEGVDKLLCYVLADCFYVYFTDIAELCSLEVSDTSLIIFGSL